MGDSINRAKVANLNYNFLKNRKLGRVLRDYTSAYKADLISLYGATIVTRDSDLTEAEELDVIEVYGAAVPASTDGNGTAVVDACSGFQPSPDTVSNMVTLYNDHLRAISEDGKWMACTGTAYDGSYTTALFYKPAGGADPGHFQFHSFIGTTATTTSIALTTPTDGSVPYVCVCQSQYSTSHGAAHLFEWDATTETWSSTLNQTSYNLMGNVNDTSFYFAGSYTGRVCKGLGTDKFIICSSTFRTAALGSNGGGYIVISMDADGAAGYTYRDKLNGANAGDLFGRNIDVLGDYFATMYTEATTLGSLAYISVYKWNSGTNSFDFKADLDAAPPSGATASASIANTTGGGNMGSISISDNFVATSNANVIQLWKRDSGLETFTLWINTTIETMTGNTNYGTASANPASCFCDAANDRFFFSEHYGCFDPDLTGQKGHGLAVKPGLINVAEYSYVWPRTACLNWKPRNGDKLGRVYITEDLDDTEGYTSGVNMNYTRYFYIGDFFQEIWTIEDNPDTVYGVNDYVVFTEEKTL